MDSQTVVAWMQVAVGAMGLAQGYASWRAGRLSAAAFAPGAAMMAMGIAILTSGWVSSVFWTIAAIGSGRILQQMFTSRDRAGMWLGLIFSVLAMPIVVIELRYDDLSTWQFAAFAALGSILVTLMVTLIVRLTRSYRRVALPSA